MIKLIDRNVSKFAAAALVGGILLAHPVYAADAPGAAMAPSATKPSSEDRVAAHIKTLHDKLKITATEEPQFEAFAKVIRENEAVVHALVEARHEKEGATAVDDLKSYKEIVDAHAAGLAKQIPAFEALYNVMPADQKANADSVFSKYEGHDHEHKDAAKKG
jgi:protein CpxP